MRTCARCLAVTEQEVDVQANPRVPGLPKIAWKEIDQVLVLP